MKERQKFGDHYLGQTFSLSSAKIYNFNNNVVLRQGKLDSPL